MSEGNTMPPFEPKHAEELRKSEERYHKMIEEVEDYAILLLDENGIVLNWNRGAEKIKGYRPAEIIGQHFSIFYQPEDRETGLPAILLNKARVDGKAVHEGWRVRKDGSRFWGSITLTALHGHQREIIGFSKVTRDLTEKKMADDRLRDFTLQLQIRNEELRKSEERYHKMIAEVQDYAIILLDTQGNIQNWNTGAEKIKGYTSDEIVGKNFQGFYAQGDRQSQLPQQLLSTAAKTGRAIHEGWRLRKDGSRFWGSIVITALHDDEKKVIGYSKVTRDLTEKKVAEDKLNEYVHELQRQNEELDRFAFATSHDLQEPLRKVMTFADLVDQNAENSVVVSRYVKKIITSAGRMLDLIRSILEYSRVSKTVTEKVETPLKEILSGVLSDYELQIQEKQAVVNSGALPVIKAIPQQVTQLFSNLLGNAFKFSKGVPVVNISANRVFSEQVPYWPEHVSPGAYWEILFEDNGIGFEPEYAEQIFSLFQRLHSKHEYNGTGIGLALCKKVMDNHYGFIYAQGFPDKGAAFYVYFPS